MGHSAGMTNSFAYLGEAAALGTAACWTASSASFEAATKRISSRSVNIIRLAMAFGFLCIFNLFYRGMVLPTDAGPRQWLWLSVSGLIGYTLGDLFLFAAFASVGARVSMLIMALAPALTALLGFIFLGESLSAKALLGMGLTMLGIAIVVLKPGQGKLKLSHPLRGILLAGGGAMGQAIGLIFSKLGMDMGEGMLYPATAAGQIRVLSGFVGFAVLYSFMRIWPQVFSALKNRQGMLFSLSGSFFGPFVGVSLSLIAVANAEAGVASSLMSITPILIIPISVFILREKIRVLEILGAALAVSGVVCMFL